MIDSGWWKPILFIIPLGALAALGGVTWTTSNAGFGCLMVAVILILGILAFRSQTRTNAQEPWWEPYILSSKIVSDKEGTFLEMRVSASNIHHITDYRFVMPHWGTVITTIKRNKVYLIRIEAPSQPFARAEGVTNEMRDRWYLQDLAKANGRKV